MNKPTLLIISLLVACTGFSQTKMVIERIQCTSSFSNIFKYLDYTEIKTRIYYAIKDNAVEALHVSFDGNETMPEFDIRTRAFGTVADRTLNSTIKKPKEGLHLFVNINENSTFLPNGKRSAKEELELLQNAYCVIDMEILVTDNNGNIKLNRQLDFVIQNKNANSIGYINNTYSMSPSGFVDFTQKATKMLLDTTNELPDIAKANCTPAYFTDNFIMPNIAGRKRAIAEIKKDIAVFTLADSTKSMLRFPDMKLYLMNLKKRDNTPYNKHEQAAIAYKREHGGGLKYCIMQHEFRNVFDNRNYTSHIAVAIDDEGVYEPIFKFLPNKINFLLAEKDTVAWFSINVNAKSRGKTIFLDRVYNGIDTSMLVTLFSKDREEPMIYAKSIEGDMGSHPFSILYSGSGVKEIFYDNQLACVVKGEKLPESFVLINANLSRETLHQLLMLAFIKNY